MEGFKKKIKQRMALLSGMVLIAVVLCVVSILAISNTTETSMAAGAIAGFQFGIIIAIGLFSFLQIVRYSIVIKSEKRLKLLYNEEHDERLKTIRSKAGMPILMVTSVVMLIAAIIAGYINITVFYTLVGAAIVQLTIGTVVKLYCMKTM